MVEERRLMDIDRSQQLTLSTLCSGELKSIGITILITFTIVGWNTFIQFKYKWIFVILKLCETGHWSTCFDFYTPPHDSGGVLWFYIGHPCVCPSIHISFPDDNLSKHQWIFTKISMYIDIVEIWFGIANGQISSNFGRVICPRHAHIFVSGWELE